MKPIAGIVDRGADPRAGLIESGGQWFTADGYPVTAEGRPDWCARCRAPSGEPAWKPPRVAPGSALCSMHQERERDMRTRRREEKQGGKRP